MVGCYPLPSNTKPRQLRTGFFFAIHKVAKQMQNDRCKVQKFQAEGNDGAEVTSYPKFREWGNVTPIVTPRIKKAPNHAN
jgi:hypothetical protein